MDFNQIRSQFDDLNNKPPRLVVPGVGTGTPGFQYNAALSPPPSRPAQAATQKPLAAPASSLGTHMYDVDQAHGQAIKQFSDKTGFFKPAPAGGPIVAPLPNVAKDIGFDRGISGVADKYKSALNVSNAAANTAGNAVSNALHNVGQGVMYGKDAQFRPLSAPLPAPTQARPTGNPKQAQIDLAMKGDSTGKPLTGIPDLPAPSSGVTPRAMGNGGNPLGLKNAAPGQGFARFADGTEYEVANGNVRKFDASGAEQKMGGTLSDKGMLFGHAPADLHLDQVQAAMKKDPGNSQAYADLGAHAYQQSLPMPERQDQVIADAQAGLTSPYGYVRNQSQRNLGSMSPYAKYSADVQGEQARAGAMMQAAQLRSREQAAQHEQQAQHQNLQSNMEFIKSAVGNLPELQRDSVYGDFTSWLATMPKEIEARLGPGATDLRTIPTEWMPELWKIYQDNGVVPKEVTDPFGPNVLYDLPNPADYKANARNRALMNISPR